MRNPEPLSSKLESIESTPDSFFIACANFEERCKHVAQMLAPNYKTENSIIFTLAEYKGKGRAPEFYGEVDGCLRSHSSNHPKEVPFSVDRPVGFLRELEKVFNGAAPPCRNITVDITAFPHEQLMMLLNFLDGHPRRGNIRLLYSEPGRYDTQDNGWLTRGVRSVHPIPGFCGIQYPQLAKLLVVIMGHEGERTHITVRRHQPDQLLLIGQGDQQYQPGLDAIAREQNSRMIAQFGEQSLKFTLPARGVLETMQTISRIFHEYRYRFNIFVAPNGTKLQVVGTYLAARRLLELQITYATPAVYNWEKFSTGTGPVWMMALEPKSQV